MENRIEFSWKKKSYKPEFMRAKNMGVQAQLRASWLP